MSAEPTTRTHIVIPTRLLEQLDELVGPRHRSEFITEAVAESVMRSGRRAALDAMLAWPPREPDDERHEFEEVAGELRRDRQRMSDREQWLEEHWYSQPE